jgi:two-component system response regulator HydG
VLFRSISRFFAKSLQNEGLPDKSFSEKAIQTLMAYPWPGNVRELENTIRSALAFATGDTIDSTDLSIISDTLFKPSDVFQDFGASLSDYELDAIRKALKQSAGNRRDAARVLGISESTLYRRIKQYNL